MRRTTSKMRRMLVIVPAAAMAMGTAAFGDVVWVGTDSTNYSDANNWSPNTAAPNSSIVNADIDSSSPNATVISSGSWTTDNLTLDGTGSLTINGGSMSVANDLVVGNTAGSSATLTVQSATTCVSHVNGPVQSMTVGSVAGAAGTVQGYGTFNLPIQLINNGKVIANGYGASNTLDLTCFNNNGQSQYVGHTVYNPGNGWYATNGGKLALATVVMQTNSNGNGNFNWGEASTFTSGGQQASTSTPLGQTSLVNSVQIQLTGVVGFDPSLSDKQTISLLDANNSAVPAPAPSGINFIGIWNMADSGSFYNFGSYPNPEVSYTFRYDDVAAAGRSASVYMWNGSAWTNVTLASSNPGDTVASVNASLVGGSNDFYAVGVPVPEPATLSLVGGGAALLLMGRRRRQA